MFKKTTHQEIKAMKKRVDESSKAVEEINIQLGELYHEIEVEAYTEEESIAKFAELQELLRKRRVIKEKNLTLYAQYKTMRGCSYNSLTNIEKKRIRQSTRVLEQRGYYKNFKEETLAIFNNTFVFS